MGIEKSALLGVYDKSLLEDLEFTLQEKGYQVVPASTVEDMLTRMGIKSDSPLGAPPINKFRLYFMDLNLGYPNSPSCQSALNIYTHVKTDIEKGESAFMGFSGNRECLEAAKNAGIPCFSKLDFRAAMDFYGSL